MKKKTFWILIILSFLVQILLSFYDTYGDVHTFFVPWAQTIEKYGTLGFYQRFIKPVGFANYPPLIILILTFFHLLGNSLIEPIRAGLWLLNTTLPFFPSGLVTFFYKDNLLLFTFMKLPNIIGNIVLSVGIYRLMSELSVKKTKSNLPAIVFVSMLFNPALIFISAMWGQVDVIPFSFAVWSFYLAFKKKYGLSVFLMTLALLAKQTAVLVLPFYVLYLYGKLTVKGLLTWATVAYLAFVAFFFPFQKTLIDKAFPFLPYMKIAGSFASDKVSMHAHNFWQMLYPGMRDNGVRGISQMLVFGFLAYIVFLVWRKRDDLRYVLSSLGIFAVFSFMFMTRMHERHLIAAIPFLAFAVLLDFRFYWILAFETIYFLVNMYAAWPIPKIESLAGLVNTGWFVNLVIVLQLLVLGYAVFLFRKKTYGLKKN